MITLTVDPDLFASPREAYDFLREHHCVRVTLLALHRNHLTHSPRYFCVTQWQEDTEQVHYHVLLDASDIPEDRLYDIWSRRRPRSAGRVHPGRPRFGWVQVSRPGKFTGGKGEAAGRAARYVTKVPDWGFPDWVMRMGAHERIRRFSTNQGFWKRPRPAKSRAIRRPPTGTRQGERERRTYAQKTSACGSTVDVFERGTKVDYKTGEETEVERWVAQVTLDDVDQRGQAQYTRGEISATTIEGVLDQVEAAALRPARILRLRRTKRRGE